MEAPLHHYVRTAAHQYLADLEGSDICNMHAIFLAECERPLLIALWEYTGGHQSQMAKMLGLSRTTLRQKLKQYAILP